MFGWRRRKMAERRRREIGRFLENLEIAGIDGTVGARHEVSQPVIDNAHVTVSISIAESEAPKLEPMRRAVEKALTERVDWVESASVVLTAERKGPGASAAATSPLAAAPPPHGEASSLVPSARNVQPSGTMSGPRKGGRAQQPGRVPPAAPHSASHSAPRIAASSSSALLPDVRHTLAIASGKGGVGKSTVACNLALALARDGAYVGLLDADIYGPSIPRLLNLPAGKGAQRPEGKGKLLPVQACGLKVMSMGLLIDEGTPMIWRAPMVISALAQMLRDVDWGALDFLVVDMPPGTGDVQLSLSQTVALCGAVIVSTPQDLALIDARKGLNMFRRVDVPVLGLVENMSYFECTQCHARHEIFGHGGARNEAASLGLPFLGAIPLDIGLRAHSDSGTPIVVAEPDGLAAQVFCDIAGQIRAALGVDGANNGQVSATGDGEGKDNQAGAAPVVPAAPVAPVRRPRRPEIIIE